MSAETLDFSRIYGRLYVVLGSTQPRVEELRSMSTPAPNEKQVTKVVRAVFDQEPVAVEAIRIGRKGQFVVDVVTETGRATIMTPYNARHAVH